MLVVFKGIQDSVLRTKFFNYLCRILGLKKLHNNVSLGYIPGTYYVIHSPSVLESTGEYFLNYFPTSSDDNILVQNLKKYIIYDPEVFIKSCEKFNIDSEVILLSKGTKHTILSAALSTSGSSPVIEYTISDYPDRVSSDDIIPAADCSTIVGWRCTYCDIILKSKRPHLCNGSYRCNRLSFAPIREEANTIEFPEGTKLRVFGNKIYITPISKK